MTKNAISSPGSAVRREATLEDLVHTLNCISHTVSKLMGPEETDDRFESLDACAGVSVFGKGHIFSSEQEAVHRQILKLMRHNGRADGQVRPMTAPEQRECARLWLTLLTLAAQRLGTFQSSGPLVPSF